MGWLVKRLVSGEDDLASIEWVAARMDEKVAGTGGLFAGLGLTAVDAVARDTLRLDQYPLEAAEIPRLAVEEKQVVNLIAQHALARRLVHVGQSLPPARALLPLQKIDALLVAVTAGLMGKCVQDLSLSQQLRVGLPFRHSGSIPGGSGSTYAQYFLAAARAEEKIRAMVANLVVDGLPVPPTLRLVVARFEERQSVEEGDFTASETGMQT
jgi:hypothetical protein